MGIKSANFGVHKCSSLPLSRRREPVDPTTGTHARKSEAPTRRRFVVSSSHHDIVHLHHGCDISIVSRGSCRTFRFGVGDAFPAIGTLVSPFVAIPAISLEFLRFGHRLLIHALVTFLALAFALAILRFPFDFPFPPTAPVQ